MGEGVDPGLGTGTGNGGSVPVKHAIVVADKKPDFRDKGQPHEEIELGKGKPIVVNWTCEGVSDGNKYPFKVRIVECPCGTAKPGAPKFPFLGNQEAVLAEYRTAHTARRRPLPGQTTTGCYKATYTLKDHDDDSGRGILDPHIVIDWP